MNLLRKIVRWSFRLASIATTILGLFLLGYLLGWKSLAPYDLNLASSKAGALSDSSSSSNIVRLNPGPSPLHSTVKGNPTETLSAKMARWARWMEPGRDSRIAEARVAVEIATMDLNEIWQAMDHLEGAPNTKSVAGLRAKLLLRWVSIDPRSAAQYWKVHLRSHRWPSDLAHDVFNRWDSFDPHGALEGWRSIAPELEEHTAKYALTGITTSLAKSDFNLALHQINTFTGDDRTAAMRGLAFLAGDETKREMVLNSLLALPEDRDRALTIAEALNSWTGGGHPEQAVDWLDGAPLNDSARSQINEVIARRWFNEDHRAAADWLVSRAETPEQRSQALESMIDMWTQYDLIQGGQWLLDQGIDEGASRSMRIYADNLANDFPQESVVWAQSIPDENLREQALVRIERKLRERHPHLVAELLK